MRTSIFLARGIAQPRTRGKRAHTAMPRARRKTFPHNCAPRQPQSRGSEGCQSSFTALQHQQSDFSYLKWTRGQRNSLTATDPHCTAPDMGELLPSHPWLSRAVQVSEAIQVICHSVENTETLSVGDLIPKSNLMVLHTDNKDP